MGVLGRALAAVDHWLATGWAWIKERLRESSSQFAFLDGAVIAALTQAGDMSSKAGQVMFALVFLKIVVPEWSKKA